MADYKELLRRAIDALPENNGAARRAVYEKARAALVGQLRAINPPLPARDITTHRLQLEDCIRQVEQEASEANIAGMTADPPPRPPVFVAEPKTAATRPELKPRAEAPARPAPKAEPARPAPKVQRPEPVKAEAARPDRAESASIEDLIAAASVGEAADQPAEPGIEEIEIEPEAAPAAKARPPRSQPVLVARSDPPEEAPELRRPAAPKPDARPLPAIVARAEAAKGRQVAPVFPANVEAGRRAPAIEPRRDGRVAAAAARKMEPMEFDVPEDVQAMAAVREVELDRQSDPQGAIDRAIATLDREARGETRPAHYTESEVELDEVEPDAADEPDTVPVVGNGVFNGRVASGARAKARGDTGTDIVVSRGERAVVPRNERGERGERPEKAARPPRPAKEFANPRRAQAARAFDGAARQQPERGGIGAVTIFLAIFATLLVGAGGAGFWAWQEGYINLDAMFGRGTPVVTAAATPATPANPDATGPGNTETPATVTEPANELRSDGQPPAQALATQSTQQPLALQAPSGGDGKIEERLGSGAETAPQTAEQAVAAIDPSAVAGSQSLLLEASDNGTTGAVPFSGTVDWSKGTDELGQPTLVGRATIPARNLSVQVLVRKNSDPSLPASHLMEINFTVSETFIGGSIAGLPGVLLKNEELVQGTPLVGASARVVGNSFLFALSAAAADAQANTNLLTSRKWMDLALIYASGKRAIITLEKDATAEALFREVFAEWGAAGGPSAG